MATYLDLQFSVTHTPVFVGLVSCCWEIP